MPLSVNEFWDAGDFESVYIQNYSTMSLLQFIFIKNIAISIIHFFTL